MSEEGEINSAQQEASYQPVQQQDQDGSRDGEAGDRMEDQQQQQQQQQQQNNGNNRSRVAGERMIKVLLTSAQAGALIGQGGSAVNELQKRTNTRIRVSNKTMTFPGTGLRVISVEGPDENVREAVRAVVDVCFHELKDEVDPNGEMILALPSSAAPIIIGRQGAKVSELVKETGCDIRLGRQSDEVPGVKERLTTLRGKREKIAAAVNAIMDLMFTDPEGRAFTYENRTTGYEAFARRDDFGRRSYRDDDRYDSRYGPPRDDYRSGGPRGDYYRDPRDLGSR